MVAYTKNGNKGLKNWGINNPLLNTQQKIKQELDEGKKMKEALTGNVIKLEKTGDFIKGSFISYERSKQFDKSFAVKIKDDSGNINVIFVSAIVIDLIETNSIVSGQQIKIEYTGNAKAKKSGMEYKTYKVFYE